MSDYGSQCQEGKQGAAEFVTSVKKWKKDNERSQHCEDMENQKMEFAQSTKTNATVGSRAVNVAVPECQSARDTQIANHQKKYRFCS